MCDLENPPIRPSLWSGNAEGLWDACPWGEFVMRGGL